MEQLEFLISITIVNSLRSLCNSAISLTFHSHARSGSLIILRAGLVSRSTRVFHFSTAAGLVLFLTCVTRRVEGW